MDNGYIYQRWEYVKFTEGFYSITEESCVSHHFYFSWETLALFIPSSCTKNLTVTDI